VDLSNPKTWADGLGTLMSAPHVIVPLLIVVAGAVWWIRGTIEAATKHGLKAQLGALNERLQLAHDQQADVTDKLEAAKAAVTTLETKVNIVPSDPLSAEATANAIDAITMANIANAKLSHTLSRADPTLQWWNHPTLEEQLYVVEYEDGEMARFAVHRSDEPSGKELRDLARDQQLRRSIPPGFIKRVFREYPSEARDQSS
jgi:hypothetical protein